MTYTPEEFKQFRKRKGWTQEKAAKELGVSKETIGNIERGSRREDGRPVKCPKYIEVITSYMAAIETQQQIIDLLTKHNELLETQLAAMEEKGITQ